MSWPQYSYIILCAIGIGVCLQRHGQHKDGKYNFWLDLFGSMPAWFFLYQGGFFK